MGQLRVLDPETKAALQSVLAEAERLAGERNAAGDETTAHRVRCYVSAITTAIMAGEELEVVFAALRGWDAATAPPASAETASR